MKLTIKNLKFAEFASHETLCFECSVYVDGKRAFTARNDGHGGPDEFWPINEDLFIKASEWAASQPKIHSEDLDFSYQPDLDHFVAELVTAELMRRDRQKAYRKGVAFISDPENDPEKIEWYPLPSHLKGEQREQVRNMWEPQIMAKNPTISLIEKDGSLRSAS